MTLNIPIPRVNANDDHVSLVKLHVAVGDAVREDDLLAEIETTKAAAEIRAPSPGVVTAIDYKAGQYVAVGATLCVLSDPGQSGGVELSPDKSALSARMVTAKARRRAEALGVDLDKVKPDASGRVTAEAVERSADKAPALLMSRSQGAIIVGAGRHAAAVIDALDGQALPIVGCVDDDPALQGKEIAGVKVIGTTDLLTELLKNGVKAAFVGVGGIGASGADHSVVRVKIIKKLQALGFDFPAVVSRHAYLGQGSVLGPGTMLFPGAVVGARCRIGEHVIINQGVQICHDCTIEDDVHITPGAILGGSGHVGASSIVGMGASLLMETSIGRNCLIHNNAAIMTDVHDRTEVYSDGRRFERAG